MSAGVLKRVVFGVGLLLCIVAVPTTSPVLAADSPTLTIDRVTLTANWREGWLTGDVEFAGKVSGPAHLTAFVRAVASGKVIAKTDYSVGGGGSFSETLKLPARPLPGLYRLSVLGSSGTSALPKVDRDLTLTAPAEGIVDKSYISLTRRGAPVRVIVGPRKELWAHFHYLVPPKARTVKVEWRTPSFHFVGAAKKPYTTTIDSFVRSAAPLDRGTWYAFLSTGGKIAKRAAIRIN